MKRTFTGRVADVLHKRLFGAILTIEDDKIISVEPCSGIPEDSPYILPGFIDSHVHIESSMLLPSEFARAVFRHGTTGIVTDPHEIANVLGIPGVEFMLDNASETNFNFCFGAPSCVPSCGPSVETSGASLSPADTEFLLRKPQIGYLSEMMNFPGVLNSDPDVLAKIEAAKRLSKKVDGHAPCLSGPQRAAYALAGISTDHECSTCEEALSCIENGMKVLIREGSSAKNFDALVPLLSSHPDSVMFCTDDIHPGDLRDGHIDALVRRAICLGYGFWDVLRAACLNPQIHYGLDWGLLRPGDPATFNIADSSLKILETWVNGRNTVDPVPVTSCPNRFDAVPLTSIPSPETDDVIVAFDGQLFTDRTTGPSETDQKIVVLNRYVPGAAPAVAWIRGFNIKDGAMSASIAHDCHNIVAVGSSDNQILKAINSVISMRGGISAVASDKSPVTLPLPIAGLMSPQSEPEVTSWYSEVLRAVADTGCTMRSPLITMSFMCLPVIPRLKLTDKGLSAL